METDNKITGLTSGEVALRVQKGQINVADKPRTRTYKQIILGNLLTFFNFLNIGLLVIVLCVRSYKNCFFVGIVIVNTVIGIIQETRTKKIIDKLSILNQSKTTVLRDGEEKEISTEELVQDDYFYLKTGNQIPTDAKIIEGTIEVNESLLTGESDNLVKTCGDDLFSGSFVTSGQALCQVVHVGSENYASKITSEAKAYKRPKSELRNSINAILKVISIIIVPMGVLLFYKQYVLIGAGIKESVVSMVAAVLGMIPEGLVLLTSVQLTLGALRLAQKKTLVQELYCIETLARVDTLCLDKTGTLTEGTMKVEDVVPYVDESQEDFTPAALEDIESVMGNLLNVLTDSNATSDALRKRFFVSKDWTLDHAISFSSDRKYSGAAFQGKGTYLMGAVQFLFPNNNQQLIDLTQQYSEKGLRVLALAHSDQIREGAELPENLQPLAFVLITDVIRAEAPDTLSYFAQQGVDLKVISGDDPVTVSAIAARAGLANADNYIDASTLASEEMIEKAVEQYSVFGRVTPQQKKSMVLALKKQGHTVAMTGDGVNDVLALKEADCSIAMANGSDAAKNIANVVLLESNFAAMPLIVNQGRQVVNNIRTAASMFVVKTIFSVLLAILTIFFGNLYPFEPIQMSLISACAVGIPTFFLALEPNYQKIDHTFLRHVFLNAFPAAITITACVFTIMLVSQNVYHTEVMLNTACFLVTGWNYMATLKTVYAPMNRYRTVIIFCMQMIFFIAAVAVQNILSLKALEFGMTILVFVLMTISPVLIAEITHWLRNFVTSTLDSENPNFLRGLVDRLLFDRFDNWV